MTASDRVVRLDPRRPGACAGPALLLTLLTLGCGGVPSGGVPDPVPARARAPLGPVSDADLPRCTAPVEAAFTRSALWAPDRQTPRMLSPSARAALVTAVAHAVRGENRDALAAVDAAGYTLCAAAGGVRLFEPIDVDGPAIAWRSGASVDVILEVPHPIHEADTLARARTAFASHGAVALLVAGSHRCASPRKSQCDGRSAVCGDEGWRISDPAHTADSAFHAVHAALVDLSPRALVISLHNMREEGISLSDGTRGAVDRDAPVARAAEAAQRALPGYPITSCNPGAGVPVEARHCGTTNVQGRHVNGSSDPCDRGASQGTGRFLHLEWNKDLPRFEADALLDALLGMRR